MEFDISDKMETTVEYLYTPDTELVDEQTKCGEIFVSFTSFDCVFLCYLCKNQSKYASFNDFADHVKGEHLVHENSAEAASPTEGCIVEDVVVEDDELADEELGLEIVVGDDVETEVADKLDLENLDSAAPLEEVRNSDLEPEVEVLLSEEEWTNNDVDQSTDRLEKNIPYYRRSMTKMLNIYRKCIGLWHTKTASSTSNDIRSVVLELLLQKYHTHYPDGTISFLLARIATMSDKYLADYQRKDRNKKTESKPWYFQHFTFLRYAECEDIPDTEFKDFNCPWCENEVPGSVDLWKHITTSHLKFKERETILPLQWPEDKILKFIDLYQKHECLWNSSSGTYRNRLLKAKAYETIIQKYNEIHPNVLKDRAAVKEAIRKLRIHLGRSVKLNLSSDPLHNSSLRSKVYEKLLFLRNVHMPRPTQNVQICNNIPEEGAISEPETRQKESLQANSKTYRCPICHLIFECSDDLATHLNEHLPHRLQKQICELCGANFDDRSNLLIHIRRHTNTKKYICSTCSKGFVTSTELKSHVVVHSNDRPFVCETCGHRFKYSNRLNTHRLVHGEPRFRCIECDMKFITKRHMTEHQRTHAPPDTPVKKINCDICGSLFRNYDSLSRHRRKIHNIKVRG